MKTILNPSGEDALHTSRSIKKLVRVTQDKIDSSTQCMAGICMISNSVRPLLKDYLLIRTAPYSGVIRIEDSVELPISKRICDKAKDFDHDKKSVAPFNFYLEIPAIYLK